MSILKEARQMTGADDAGTARACADIAAEARPGRPGTNAEVEPAGEELLFVAGQPIGITPLGESVSGVYKGVSELKAQLLHLIRINKALESDLAKAHGLLQKEAAERDSLILRLHEAQWNASTTQDTAEEVDRIRRERDILARNVGETSHALAVSEERLVEIGQLLDRFRSERNDAHEEASCLDLQFQRAMKVIGELRADLSARESREVDLLDQIRSQRALIDRTAAERDGFKSELADSHEALENVRQTILNASKEWRDLYSEE